MRNISINIIIWWCWWIFLARKGLGFILFCNLREYFRPQGRIKHWQICQKRINKFNDNFHFLQSSPLLHPTENFYSSSSGCQSMAHKQTPEEDHYMNIISLIMETWNIYAYKMFQQHLQFLETVWQFLFFLQMIRILLLSRSLAKRIVGVDTG